MAGSRLLTALRSGVLNFGPAARIGVFRPPADFDASDLPDQLHMVQGFKPAFDALSAAGQVVSVAPEPPYDAIIVCVPRAKDEARELIGSARAMTDGPVVVDGQKTDGVEGLLREIRRRAEVGEVISKRHGKLFAFTGGDFSDWAALGRPKEVAGFYTVPGVFSADGVDPGSAMLAPALPVSLKGRVADLGAGWGYLSRAVLERDSVEEVHLIEAEHAALECARRNVTDPRAHFYWADARRFQPEAVFDAIVCNPPFHQGRAADQGMGRGFIAAAAGMLKPSGTLWLVANRHLAYEAALAEVFADAQEVAGDRSFKVFHARKPRRGRR